MELIYKIKRFLKGEKMENEKMNLYPDWIKPMNEKPLTEFSVKNGPSELKELRVKEKQILINHLHDLFVQLDEADKKKAIKSEDEIKSEIRSQMRVTFDLAWTKAFGPEVFEVNKRVVAEELGL